MINNDILIKLVRAKGVINWPDQVNYIRLHLPELLKGFPGIGLGHLSIVEYQDLTESDTYILDQDLYCTTENNNQAPVMIREGKILGIGLGKLDYNIGENFTQEIPENTLVLRVDCRPKETGGPGYYYFYKSKRDYRNNED